MAPIRVHAANSYFSAYLLLGFLVATSAGALVGHEVDPAKLGAASVLGCLGFVALWVKSVQGKRWVEIDASRNQVSIRTVSPFFSPRTIHYPLSTFGAIRSYITVGRYPRNLVELVTQSGGEALLVAVLPPSNGAKSFWSMPSETENSQAATLRQQIAAYASLMDQGFLGSRLTGAQLKDR